MSEHVWERGCVNSAVGRAGKKDETFHTFCVEKITQLARHKEDKRRLETSH